MNYAIYEDPITHKFAMIRVLDRFADGVISRSRRPRDGSARQTMPLGPLGPVHPRRVNHASLEHIMNVRPLHDRLIVQRLDEGEQQVGGIIIPDTAKEKPQQGKVIAAGAGKVNDDGKRVVLDVRAGDLILFGKYSGQEIKLEGEEYLIMREDEVLAVLDKGQPKTSKK
jgi:chaperonin GroES